MTIIGSAHVVIRGITDKLQGDIEKALDSAIKKAGSSGSDSGKEYSESFNKQTRDKVDFGLGGAERAAAAAGNRAGDAFSDGFTSRTDGKIGLNLSQKLVDRQKIYEEGERGGEALVDGVTDAVDQNGGGIRAAFARIGGGGRGGIFNALLGDSGSQQAGQGLRRAALQLDALSGAVAVAVGALASLASGLFSVGSAAAGALPSLIALPAALGAIIAGAIGTVLAFRGVGDAIKAGIQASEQSGEAAAAAAQRQSAAARAVESARRALGDAYENSSLRIERAQERVEDAEYTLAQAQLRARDAQEGINRARLDAIERLQDLEFAVRGGAIAEEEAVLRLEQAQADLAEVENAPRDSRIYRERELAHRAAVLRLDEIRERNEDLAKEEKEAARTGVEGSEEVVSAKRREADANHALREAQEGLTDAQAALAREQRDAARDIADAQQRVADALQQQAQAANTANAAQTKFNQAMEKLSPSARAFVRHILEVREEYGKLSDMAALGLFPHLINASNTILNNGLLDQIGEGLRRITHEVGVMIGGLADLTNQPFFRGNLQTVIDGTVRTLSDFGNATVALVGYLTALFAAADPVLQQFSEWIERLSLGAQTSLDTGEEMDAMRDKFTQAGAVMSQLGRITRNIWEGIKNLGRAAAPAGQMLLEEFERVSAGWAEMDDEITQSRLGEYFDGVADNVIIIGGLLSDLGRILAGTGDSEGLGETARILREEFLPVLEEILEHGLEELGPALADALVAMAEAFQKLSETGALEVFLGVLETFADWITDLMENPLAAKLITWLLAFEAALAALALIRNFTGIGMLVGYAQRLAGINWGKIVGGVAGLGGASAAADAATAAAAGGTAAIVPGGPGDPDPDGKKTDKKAGAFKRMKDALKGMPLLGPIFGGGALAAIGAALGPILLVVGAIAALVGIFIAAYKNSEELREAVDRFARLAREAWNIIGREITAAWENYIQPALAAFATWIGDRLANVINGTVWIILNVLAPTIAFLWNNVVKPAFRGIGTIISFTWNNVVMPVFRAISWWIKNVTIPVIMFLWNNVVKPAFRGISFAVEVAWAVVRIIFAAIVATIRNVLGPIFIWLWNNVIKPAFEGIGQVVSFTWNNIIRPILSALGSFITDTVAPAFARGVDMIGGAWSAIQEMARTPINFVIDTVYNNGIKKVFDSIAQAVGSDVRLPKASLIGQPAAAAYTSASRYVQARERGGYTPPGMTLVGEKGPELVNFSKSGWVYNASTTKLLMKGLGDGPVKGGLTWEGIKGAIAGAKDFVLGNLRNAAKKLLDPIMEMMRGVGGSGMFGEILRGVVRKGIDMVTGFGGKQDAAAELAGGAFERGSGNYPPAVLGRVAANTAAAVRYVQETFGVNNIGTLGNRPNRSDHPMGKALDVMIKNWSKGTGVTLGNQIASFFVQNPKAFGTKYVIWRDKINTGSGWRSYVHPSGNTTNPTLRHMDHVHVSLFDQGGYLKNGMTALNLSGRPERVLTPRQTDAFDRLVDYITSRPETRGGASAGQFVANVSVTNPGATADDIAGEILFAARRMRRGGVYS